MNLIWITSEFPSNSDNIKGIYIYRTVKELAKYYKIYVICLYPSFPPILEMLRYLKDAKKVYSNWKKNYNISSNKPVEINNAEIYYLKYYRLPRKFFHHIEGWFAYFQARKYLTKIIDGQSIIHANWIFPAGTMAKIIAKKYKIPFIISLLGSDVNRLKEGSIFWKSAKKLLNQTNKVTAVTSDLFEKCKEKRLSIESSKMELIDNIYESDKFNIKDRFKIREFLKINNELKIIFFAGGLVPVKNVDILIKAVARILNYRSDLNLYIAGSGTDENKLKRLTKELKINSKVFFLGPLLSDELVNFYNAANLFSLQSRSEGLPNVIVESFLCGTPVVASSVGGIPSIIKEGINGFLVKPNSVDDLTNKIEASLKHLWDRNKIRESASQYFPGNVIKKYHHLYKNIADNFVR